MYMYSLISVLVCNSAKQLFEIYFTSSYHSFLYVFKKIKLLVIKLWELSQKSVRYVIKKLWPSNSYTIGCAPVREDNHELKRVDYLTYRLTNMVLLSYTTLISVGLAHHGIFRAEVDNGGIKFACDLCS